MSFWSGETLKSNLPSLITIDGQNAFRPSAIDCAAYRLRMGKEVFVTSATDWHDVTKGVKLTLKDDQPFLIPPGQFALLLTEECIEVPESAIAFISIRTDQKFAGLVNVSGFHVDPGWKGHLIFSVYNAGPSPLHLSRGKEMFLIWYAQLGPGTTDPYRGQGKGSNRIDEKYTNRMAAQVHSPIVIADRLSKLEGEVALFKGIGIALFIAIAGLLIKSFSFGQESPAGEPQTSINISTAEDASPPAAPDVRAVRDGPGQERRPGEQPRSQAATTDKPVADTPTQREAQKPIAQ